MSTINKILLLLEEFSGIDNIQPEMDIFKDLGLVGDDFHEMIEKYASMFQVDMTGYLWYFHADEEGTGSLGALFFKPPYKQVERIPITPVMLAGFADKKKWLIEYPEHKISSKRYDLLINNILLLIILILIIITLI